MATAEVDVAPDIGMLVRTVLEDQRRFSSSPHQLYSTEAERLGGAIGRMLASSIGMQAASLVGNEGRTASILTTASLEFLYGMLRSSPGLSEEDSDEQANGIRVLATVPQYGAPPTLLVLDPRIHDIGQSQVITDSVRKFDPSATFKEIAAAPQHPDPTGSVLKMLLASGPAGVEDVFSIIQPEVIVAHRPGMRRLCAPSPCIAVEAPRFTSTAGVVCRDGRGALGVSACLHGTGPEGTPVTVGLVRSTVGAADVVQDIVFIPLPEGYNTPPLRGLAGVRRDGAPGEADDVSFEGATSGKVDTFISSHDAGLLRHRKTVQLKVQTPADANIGDSGCALVDANDRVLGFAFESSDCGEKPQITDWIWAANALDALGLTPV